MIETLSKTITDIAKSLEKTETENYKKIKPKGNITVEKSKSFWSDFFKREKVDNKVGEQKTLSSKSKMESAKNNITDQKNEKNVINVGEIRGNSNYQDLDEKFEGKNNKNEITSDEVYRYDDNGKLYRVGDNLLPDMKYTVNGYEYTTDKEGRIVSAEGKLHLKDHEGRLPIKDSIEVIGKGDQLAGDYRGHLIGDQFGGSNGLENMVPQDANINRNDFRNFENELAKNVKDGKEVKVKVEPIYEADSWRPSGIISTYFINGEESVRFFPNSQEERL